MEQTTPLSTLVARIRAAVGASQENLAEAAVVSMQTVQQCEDERRRANGRKKR